MPDAKRNIFDETNDTITLVLENEYFKIYNDPRAGKTYKVIDGKTVPLALRELNMWKNRQKNPSSFVVKPLKDASGNVVDYEIERAVRGAAPSPEAPAPAPAPQPPVRQTPPAPQAPMRQAAPAPQAPMRQAAPAPQAPMRQAAPAGRPNAGRAAAPATIVIPDKDRESRIKFEAIPEVEQIFANELFSVFRNTKTGRTFKVINGEVANIEVRELNMWKNRGKNPGGFAVTIVNDSSGQLYDYRIERISDPAAQAPAAAVENAPAQAPAPERPAAPSLEKRPAAPERAAAPERPAAPEKPAAAPVRPAAAPQRAAQRPRGASMTKEVVGERPTGRVVFVENDTTELVLETEFCKFYKDKRAPKIFKVVENEIIQIEQRELNMWKNRTKNPAIFAVTIMKDSSGKPFDYQIARINEDGSLTAAPVVVPPAPVIMPDTPAPDIPLRSETPGASAPSKAAANAPAPTQETVRVPDKKRVKFEETPTMKLLLENEYFKIYTDSRRGATFKVINGEIAPLPQRELNMWKNRKRRPGDFAVKVINDPEGKVYDYEITRTSNPTAAVETTSTKTNLPPVTERINMGGSFKRPNSNRITNCAICNNRYKESELFLLDGKNICASCMEVLVREKLNVTQLDPVQKNIDDIVSADEIYCTYSLVTNYPYLDDEFCVNVCTIKRAAEIGIDDTIAQTIDEKGAFFDDLKRYGLKKIIVNNDSSHVYAPEDFDSHVKTEGVIAPKLYFKVLNFMQHGDDSLRTAIAESFLGSKVYTFALNQDINEITDENLDDFKPLTFTDGKNTFCPVFTDFTEARAVGMPFKGLYEIETRHLAYHKITHYIINPSSLGFIMNKSILKGAKPNYDKAIIDENDERLKNIDTFVNPFDLEDDVLRKMEEEKAAEQAKIISDIKDEAEKKVAEAKAAEDAAKQAADTAISQANDARKQAELAINDAKKQADLAKKERGDLIRRVNEAEKQANAAKITAEEAVKRAQDAEAARDAEAERADKAVAESVEIAEKTKKELEEKFQAELKAKDEEMKKAKAEAEAKAAEEAKSKLPPGVPLAAAAAFKNGGGFVPPAAASAGLKPQNTSGGIFFNDEDHAKSPLDALSLGNDDGPQLPSLDLSGLADDPVVVEPEEAAPSSYYKPQNARKEPLPPPVNEFKKTNIYGSKQIAKDNGMGQKSIYESAAKRSVDFYVSSASASSAAAKAPVQQPVSEPAPSMRRPVSDKIDKLENPNDLVISSVSGGLDGGKVKKEFKVSKPLFIEDVPDDEAMATPYSDGIVSSVPVTNPSTTRPKGVNTVLSEIAQENEKKNDMLDLSSLMFGDQPASTQRSQKMSIQDQAAKTKSTARALEVESDPMTAKDLRDKLEDCYRDLAKLIANADVMYAEFDAHTRHILIDGNNKGHIFSEKYLADKSVENFARNGIKVYLQEYKSKDIFNMLFEYRRHGIQELVLDETAHWVIIPTDKISEMLDVYERDFVKIPVMNPELMFSMTTLFQKLQTKSNNPNKEQEVRALEKRMIREFITARYVLPMYGNSRDDLRPVTIDDKNGGKKVLVFSDEFEMKRFFGENASIVKDYEIVNYKEILRKYTVQNSTVVVLNEGSLRFEFNERNCDHISKVLES